MKYIIEIPDDGQCQYRYNEDTKELKFPCPRFDPNSFMGLDITISGATPYTEPDRKAIEDEVWEFASMLMNMHPDVAEDIYLSMNGGKGIGVAAEMTYQEAKAKYDAWKKKKEEIRVGDEVIYNSRTKAIVLKPETKERYGTILTTSELATISVSHDDLEKTGRHFNEVEELIKKMRDTE